MSNPTQSGAASRLLGLVLWGWKTSLACLFLGMLVSFLMFGFWMPYWRIADQDLILAYQGLLLNDRLPQEYFDHTGYLYHLALAGWYRLLHWAGLLQVHALSELPPASDAAAFDRAWQGLVRSGRVLSLLMAGAFVGVFASLMRRLVGDWRIAVLAALALAYSSGVAMHFRVMRTELLSAGFVAVSLMLVLLAARAPRAGGRLALLAGAGLCASLAVVTKVQALFPVLAIPAIALAFVDRAEPAGAGRKPWLQAIAMCVLVAATAWPVAHLFHFDAGLLESDAVKYRPLGGGLSDLYQWVIALWVAGAMAVYGIWSRASLADAVAAMAAVALGIALGLLTLDIRYHVLNAIAVAHPLEHMFGFAAAGDPALREQSQVLSGTLVATLLKGVRESLSAHIFVLRPSHRPTLLLEWFAIAGAVVAWRRGDRRPPLQIALLIATVWGLDAIFTLRGLKLEYFAYSDPFLILAAALMLARYPDLLSLPLAQRVLLVGLVIYIVWAHAEPVKAAFSRKDPRENCYWFPHLIKRVEQFPFCRATP